jgi:two-component system cell cycle sensor histidine kinase/response regulator CckA
MLQQKPHTSFSPQKTENPHTSSKDHQKMKGLSDLFSLLTSDPEENIRIIVQQACDVLKMACSMYNCLDEEQNLLISWAGCKLPPDFPKQDDPKGHICFEATIKSGHQSIAFEDLAQTPFWQSDSYVKRLGLRCYLGCPVFSNGRAVGSLCVADTSVRRFDETDLFAMGTLARAVSLEEERKRDRAELRRGGKKYRRLYNLMRLMTDNVPDCIWAKDMEDRYIYANQATCDKLLKCNRPEDAIGRTDQQFAESQRLKGYQHTFSEISLDSDQVVKKQKTMARFLEEGLVRNQNIILDVHKAPFWDENGRIIGTVGCGRDLTNEKNTEKMLDQGESRYRELFRDAPVMLYSIDRHNRLTSISNLWLETMGYRRDDVLGRKALDFMTPESRRNALEIYMPELYQTGHIQNQPFQVVTNEGRLRNVMLSARAQRDPDGNYAGAFVCLADMTESGAAGTDNPNLSNRIQQARKMETIATLAGGIAHQFNNALAVILGNLELIEMDGLRNEKLARYVEPISQAGQKMVQLTSQLLAYARGGKFKTQRVTASTFVKETLQLVGHSLAPYINIEAELDDPSAHVEVDTTQMQMLLAAVLSNASEAIKDQGTVRIKLSDSVVGPDISPEYPGLKSGRYVLLQIADNGKGMDEQTLARIFEPFFTTKFQGRGLGMAAVYGIVKKHKGYIYVKSQPGKGTQVQIYLPSMPPPVQASAISDTCSAARAGTALIVEDEELVMEIHRTIVERLGYRVLEAASGKEAIRLVKEHNGPIDFVLLDIILPDMNGTQIYPQLMESRPDLKVIVCSGFALDGPATQILEAGAHHFIQKPFTMSALSAVLKDVLIEQN